MKSKLSALLCTLCLLFLCLAGTARADDPVTAYPVTGGRIYISAAGVVTSCDKTVTEAVIPSTTAGGAAVKEIKGKAFYDHENLKSVTIPDSVTSIGQYAFEYCVNLERVTMPAGAVLGYGAFYHCPAVSFVHLTGKGPMADYSGGSGHTPWVNGATSSNHYNGAGDHDVTVTIDSGVTSIGAGAFSGATNLTEIDVPDTVTSIGKSAFKNCAHLADGGFLATSITTIGEEAFSGAGFNGTITLTQGLASIGNNTFYDCESLKGIVIPDSVTKIGQYAFEYCLNLEKVTIPAGAVLGYGAFYHCPAINYVHINGRGDMADYSGGSGHTPWVNGGTSSNHYNGAEDHDLQIVMDDGITSIGAGAFAGSTNLSKITVPDSVTSIGADAFKNCAHLADGGFLATSITSIGEGAFSGAGLTGIVTLTQGLSSIGNNTFYDCESLKGIVIPDSVTKIGQYAFEYCLSLEKVTIPAGALLGYGAFYHCPAVNEVRINGSGEMADYSGGSGHTPWVNGATSSDHYKDTPDHPVTVTIDSGVTSIGAGAFAGSTNLSKVTVPDSVTSIGANAFKDCAHLADGGFLSTSITTIGEGAFSGAGLTGIVTLTQGLSSIGNNTFYDCESLKGIVIPDSVTEIGQYAFEYCLSLEKVTIPAGAVLGYGAFYHCPAVNEVRINGSGEMTDYSGGSGHTPWVNGAASTDGHEVTVTIDSGVTSIGAGAFAGSTNLSKITVPDTVTSIGANAFKDCTHLGGADFLPGNVTELGAGAFSGTGIRGTVELGSGVTAIGNNTFYDCPNLTGIVIPDTVKTIGQYAFEYCTGLKNVTMPAGAALGYGAFYHCPAINYVCLTGDGPMVDYSGGNSDTPWKNGATSANHDKGAEDHDITVVLSEGVTTISEGAFNGCTNLNIVMVPESLKTIAKNAFNSCGKLTDVYYAGSKEGWAAVSKADGNGRLSAQGVTIHYGRAAAVVLTGADGSTVASFIESFPDGSTVCCAFYNRRGVLTDLQTRSAESGTSFGPRNAEAVTAKIMVLNPNMVPLSAVRSYPLS